MILEAEDEQCLKEYEEMLQAVPFGKGRSGGSAFTVTDVAGVQGASGTVVSEGDFAVCEKAVETGDLYW